MRRLLLALLALASAAAASAAQPLVWRIDGPQAVHYIAGSVHALRDSDYPLPAAYGTAYAATAQLVLEVDAGETDGGRARERALAAGKLPRGKTLCKLLGADGCAEAERLARTAGVDMGKVQRFEPWRAALTLTADGVRELGLDAALGVDRHLLERARADRRTVLGLETAADQFAAFDGLSAELQKRLLIDSLEQLPSLPAALERIVTAWRDGDLAALAAQQDGIGEAPELHTALFAARHARWLPQLERLFRADAPTLVVVGAQHLVGKDSLLLALERAGFAPRRIE
jgi:uncharacterized protein YbaP (TraB family)